MKRICTFTLLTLMAFCAVAQNITLTFTGRDDNNQYMPLNRVVVINHTQGWQETLVWPDTTLTMQKNIEIAPIEANEVSPLQLSQNNPNPFNGTTDVMLTTVKEGAITLEITDMNGRVVEMVHAPFLQMGTHLFHVTMARMGTYVLTAQQNGNTSSIKMVCNEGNGRNRIEYLGVETHGRASLHPTQHPRPRRHHGICGLCYP